MGCVPSKEHDPPLVTLCRHRKHLLKSAADRRFALAGAHIAYFTELRHVGNSLCRFVEEELVLSATSSPSSISSPVLTLPSDEGKKTKKSTKASSDLREDGSSSHLNLSSFSSSDGHIEIDEEIEQVKPEKKKVKKKSTSSHTPTLTHTPGVSYIPNPPNPAGNYSDNYSYPNYNPAYYPPPPDDFSNYSSYANPAYPTTAPVYPPFYNASSNYYPDNYGNYDGSSYDIRSSYTSFNYMRKSSAQIPSVIYEEPKQNPIYSYSNYPPSGDYPDYPPPNPGGGYFGGMMNREEGGSVSNRQQNWQQKPQHPNAGGGYFGGMMNREEGGSVSNRQQNWPQKPPPPPPVVPTPPSPKVSAWDYFNPFETFGLGEYYSQDMHGHESNSSSPDSREVREREGIPELEEETESEVTKEPYKDKRKVQEEFSFPKSKNKHVQFEDFEGRNSGNNGNKKKKKKGGNFSEKTSKTEPINNHRKEEEEQESFRAPEPEPFRAPDPKPLEMREEKRSFPETDSSISTSLDDISFKKKGVSFDVGGSGTSHLDLESSKPSSLTTLSNHGTRDLREVVREIKDEFEAATDYGKEVSVLLEVDKEPYRSRNTLKVILAKVCSASLSSYHSPSSLAEGYPGTAEDDLDSRSLASTLDKLYAWEKKLYKEVKDEEKLRVMYEKQCERLKDLDDRGAESSKIEASQATIRKLLTKINVSVRAIDSISSRIHKLRDDELQPQLKELIYGLRRMWKLLFKCHQKQFQAILESKIRAMKANTGLRRDSSVRATIQLEAELLKWCHRFHHWIDMQRSYAEALNNWLEKCLMYEPEITSDGPVPYSPGKIGAPQVFITCHDWKDAMERISDSTVQTTLHAFATSLHQLWERQDEEQRRRLTAEITYKDFEKQISAAKMERQRRDHDHHHDCDHDAETSSEKNSLSMVASESGISALDDLDSIKERMREERAGHKEAVKMVHDAVSRSIQGGLVPIFEALESFTSEASKAFDEVRLENVKC